MNLYAVGYFSKETGVFLGYSYTGRGQGTPAVYDNIPSAKRQKTWLEKHRDYDIKIITLKPSLCKEGEEKC